MSNIDIFIVGVVLGFAVFFAYGIGWFMGFKEAYRRANLALDDFIAKQEKS